MSDVYNPREWEVSTFNMVAVQDYSTTGFEQIALKGKLDLVQSIELAKRIADVVYEYFSGDQVTFERTHVLTEVSMHSVCRLHSIISNSARDDVCDLNLLRHINDLIHQVRNQIARRVGISMSSVRPLRHGDPDLVEISHQIGASIFLIRDSIRDRVSRNCQDDQTSKTPTSWIRDEYPVYEMFEMEV
jgi:hypothetical protein